MKNLNRGIRILPVLTLFFLIVAVASGADPNPRLSDQPTHQPTEALTAAPLLETPADTLRTRPLSPLMQDIQAVWTAQRAALAELETRFAAVGNEEEALAIQLRIEKIKADTELQILTLQLEHARRDGRPLAQIEKLEAAIKLVTEPQPVRPPRPRDTGGLNAGN